MSDIVDLCENILAKDDCVGAMLGLNTEECMVKNRCPYCVGITLRELGYKKDAIIAKLKGVLNEIDQWDKDIEGKWSGYQLMDKFSAWIKRTRQALKEVKQMEREE